MGGGAFSDPLVGGGGGSFPWDETTYQLHLLKYIYNINMCTYIMGRGGREGRKEGGRYGRKEGSEEEAKEGNKEGRKEGREE